EIDLGAAGFSDEHDRRCIFDRPLTKPTLFEQGAEAARKAEAPNYAIKRVPAMSEQYSAAGHYWICSPGSTVSLHAGSRVCAQGMQANSPHGAKRDLVDKRRNTLTNRRFEPVVDNMNGAPTGRSRGRYRLRIL